MAVVFFVGAIHLFQETLYRFFNQLGFATDLHISLAYKKAGDANRCAASN